MKRIVPFVLSLALLQCSSESTDSVKSSDASEKSANNEPKKTEQTSPVAANPFAGLGPLGALMGAKLDEPGPYDEAKQSPGWSKDKPYFAVLELKGLLTDLAPISWWGASGPVLQLRSLTQKLTTIAAEPNITGLIIRFSELETDLASAQELRTSLLEFRKHSAEKPLLCHAENITNVIYYIMTACDQIALEPLGSISISGAAATPIHIKELLQNFGVYADIIQVGAYKGAGEFLTRNEPSPEMRKTLEAIVDVAYQTLLEAIQQRIQISQEDVEKLIDQAIFHGTKAVESKLIDKLETYPQFLATMVGPKEWKKVSIKSQQQTLDFSELQRFLGLLPPQKPHEPHVAVIYAIGNIVEGDGQGTLGAREQIAARTISAAIRAIAADVSVAAIVLRINSGGGSANASEQIWTAVSEAKKLKPVIVSMGRVAGSGGYYIAADATKIYASATTLTGSIGVIGGKIVLGEALEKLGIHVHSIARGKRALMWSPLEPWKTDEKAAVMEMMEAVYKQFVERVAQGRNKPYDSIHEIAQGRVWTGVEAKKLGLVDELGGLDQAIGEARKLANISENVELEIYPPAPTLKDLLKTFGEVSLPYGLQTVVGEVSNYLGLQEALITQQLLTSLVLLQDQNVQTLSVFPVVVQ